MATNDIENIDRPYDSHLFRSEQETSNGSVENQPVKTEGSLNDVWIDTYFRSTNWAPKTRGFYIDGQTGYAEFANVYVTGTIEGATIIGSSIKTSNGPKRIEIDGTTNEMRYYENNLLVLATNSGGMEFSSGGTVYASVSADPLGAGVLFTAQTGHFFDFWADSVSLTDTDFFGPTSLDKTDLGGNGSGARYSFKNGYITNLYGYSGGSLKWSIKESFLAGYWGITIPFVSASGIQSYYGAGESYGIAFGNPIRFFNKNGTPSITPSLEGMTYFDSGTQKLRVYTSSGWADVGGASGANTQLSNLTTTSVNQHLLPMFTDNLHLGSSLVRWKNLYLSGNISAWGHLSVDTAGVGNMAITSSFCGNLYSKATFYGDFFSCPIPITKDALSILRSTKHKKLAKGMGHSGDNIEYVDIHDAPSQCKKMLKKPKLKNLLPPRGKDVIDFGGKPEMIEEEDIELSSTVGFLYSCVKELNEKVDLLEKQLAKKP